MYVEALIFLSPPLVNGQSFALESSDLAFMQLKEHCHYLSQLAKRVGLSNVHKRCDAYEKVLGIGVIPNIRVSLNQLGQYAIRQTEIPTNPVDASSWALFLHDQRQKIDSGIKAIKVAVTYWKKFWHLVLPGLLRNYKAIKQRAIQLSSELDDLGVEPEPKQAESFAHQSEGNTPRAANSSLQNIQDTFAKMFNKGKILYDRAHRLWTICELLHIILAKTKLLSKLIQYIATWWYQLRRMIDAGAELWPHFSVSVTTETRIARSRWLAIVQHLQTWSGRVQMPRAPTGP